NRAQQASRDGRPRAAVCVSDMTPYSSEQHDTVRLDLWLWAARFYKTRSLARHAIQTGKVEVDGQRAKPARSLRGGEVLKIGRAGEIFERSEERRVGGECGVGWCCRDGCEK